MALKGEILPCSSGAVLVQGGKEAVWRTPNRPRSSRIEAFCVWRTPNGGVASASPRVP